MILVYTSIIGDFDELREPEVVSDECEYICYTDQPLVSNIWKIINVSVMEEGEAKTSKYYKIMQPTEGYDKIIWVDGSMKIIGDTAKFISLLPDCNIVTSKHRVFPTIEKELNACLQMKKDEPDIMKSQVKEYTFNNPYTHCQNGIMVKYGDVSNAMSIWWEEVRNKSKRDQLSFEWSMEQANQKYCTFDFNITKPYFKWFSKHKPDVKH